MRIENNWHVYETLSDVKENLVYWLGEFKHDGCMELGSLDHHLMETIKKILKEECGLRDDNFREYCETDEHNNELDDVYVLFVDSDDQTDFVAIDRFRRNFENYI